MLIEQYSVHRRVCVTNLVQLCLTLGSAYLLERFQVPIALIHPGFITAECIHRRKCLCFEAVEQTPLLHAIYL